MVPRSGNLITATRQFWLGAYRRRDDRAVLGRHRRDPPADRRGPDQVVAPPTPASICLARLVAEGRRQRRAAPLPAPEDGEALEVDGTVNRHGAVSLVGRQPLAAEILGGRQVGIRISTRPSPCASPRPLMVELDYVDTRIIRVTCLLRTGADDALAGPQGR